jgi:hypothetical protein
MKDFAHLLNRAFRSLTSDLLPRSGFSAIGCAAAKLNLQKSPPRAFSIIKNHDSARLPSRVSAFRHSSKSHSH